MTVRNEGVGWVLAQKTHAVKGKKILKRLAILKLIAMAWIAISISCSQKTKMLARGDSDLEYTNALHKFGKEQFDLLYPDFYDSNEHVIWKDTDWSFIDI